MAKIIIEIDEKTFGRIFHRDCIGQEYDYEVTRAILNGTKLPDNATNGDVIKAMFPHHDIEVNEQKNYVQIFYDSFYTTYSLRWWLEPYKAGDTE